MNLIKSRKSWNELLVVEGKGRTILVITRVVDGISGVNRTQLMRQSFSGRGLDAQITRICRKYGVSPENIIRETSGDESD